MKNYLLALLFACFTTVSMSQEIRYGVRGALNVSNLDFDPDATFENQHRNGFAFGGFVDFGLTEDVSLFDPDATFENQHRNGLLLEVL